MTSNHWIESMLKDIPTFLGVYSSDEIPCPTYFPSSCILNFSGKNYIGTHFIVLLYNRNYCTYFDPLNLDFISKIILDFMETYFSYNIRIIRFKVQHDLSNFCGLYCMFVCLIQYQNKHILPFLHKTFPSPKLSNDEKVVDILCRQIHDFYNK